MSCEFDHRTLIFEDTCPPSCSSLLVKAKGPTSLRRSNRLAGKHSRQEEEEEDEEVFKRKAKTGNNSKYCRNNDVYELEEATELHSRQTKKQKTVSGASQVADVAKKHKDIVVITTNNNKSSTDINNTGGDQKQHKVGSSNNSETNEVHEIIMKVDGITCNPCIEVIETCLRGCIGGKLLIDGLLDAVAGLHSKTVVLRIDDPTNANFVVKHAKYNLYVLGYGAKVKGSILGDDDDHESGSEHNEAIDEEDIDNVVDSHKEVMVLHRNKSVFDWNLSCTCKGTIHDVPEKCPRHRQINLITWEDSLQKGQETKNS